MRHPPLSLILWRLRAFILLPLFFFFFFGALLAFPYLLFYILI